MAELFPKAASCVSGMGLVGSTSSPIKMGDSAEQACGLLAAGARLILKLKCSAGGARLLCWSSCVLPVDREVEICKELFVVLGF